MKLKEGSVYRSNETGDLLLCVGTQRVHGVMRRVYSPKRHKRNAEFVMQHGNVTLIGNNYQERAKCKSS